MSLESGKLDQALEIFLQSCVRCDKKSTLLFLKECAKRRCVEIGKNIHAESVKDGMERDVILGTTLIDMYAKCGCLTEAKDVFDKLEPHDVVSWSALISGYAEFGFSDEILKCLAQMQADDIAPNAVTYIFGLKGCGNVGDIEKAYKLHAEITRGGFEAELFMGSTLVDTYAKCGFLEEAQEIFDELTVRNIVTWNALITGYADFGICEAVLDNMKKMEFDGVSPDTVTYMCCLKGCGNLRIPHTAQSLYMQIVAKGLENNFNLGCMVVYAFTKCCLCSEAVKVFESLSVRDPTLWNTLIGGLMENGRFNEVLVYKRQMDVEGVFSGAGTLIHFLKACGSLQVSAEVQEMHALIVKRGYGEDLSVCNVVMDAYLQSGLLKEAVDIFDKLPCQDVVSWTTMIAGYVDIGLGKEALAFLDKMPKDEVGMDGAIFICSLKACTFLKDICRGQALHTEIIKDGYEKDLFISNTMIDMYVKCGMLTEAREIFDELPCQDGVSWNAMISGYADNGQFDRAFELSSLMFTKGILLSAVTYICNLKSCATIGLLAKGQDLHSEIVKQGLETDIFLASTIIDMYSGFCLFVEAWSILERLGTREAVPWNVLIAGYVDHSFGDEALRCTANMQMAGVLPDAVTYVSLLKGCSITGRLEVGQKMHVEIINRGLEEISCIESTLVDMYVKCGSFIDSCKVFDSICNCDVVAWTTLIMCHAECSSVEEVSKCLRQMAHEGVLPNSVTYVCSLKACCNARDVHKGQEIYYEIAKDGFEEDVCICCSLVDMYAKCGLFAEAHEVILELPVSDVSSSTALISGFAEHGFCSEALHCLEQMERDGMLANAISYTCTLKACGSIGSIDKGLDIHGKIVSRGLEKDLLTGSTLVDMYMKCGCLDEAGMVFENLNDRDIISWNALFGGYGCQGEFDSVLMFLLKMTNTDIVLDRITFLSILFACSHSGSVEEGLMFFEAMSRKCNINPCMEHCNCLIDLLIRAGQYDVSLRWFANIPFQPDLVTWSTLLGFCQKWGNVQLSDQAFSYAASIGEDEVAAFLQICRLSSAYAD